MSEEECRVTRGWNHYFPQQCQVAWPCLCIQLAHQPHKVEEETETLFLVF